jgi:hypothetical protein
MTAKERTRVKYALAVYRHEMGFRGPVGHGSGFDWIDGHDKAEIEEIVADRVARDAEFRVPIEAGVGATASEHAADRD